MAVYCSQCGTKNSDDAGRCQSCNATIARVIPNSGGAADGSREINITFMNVLIAGVCVLYLINPTAGILELIPDNIPLIGNLDEAAAVTGLLMTLSKMGLIPWKRTS